MAPEWVNAVQRTQTAHLPDPVDPRPIQQGIGVYFTEMEWGGVPMAVIEDRKFKSGPGTVLAAANPEKGSNEMNPRETDDPEVTAQKKGSGHGVLVAEPGRKKLRFEMWRYDFEAGKPKKGDQFEGFPVGVDL